MFRQALRLVTGLSTPSPPAQDDRAQLRAAMAHRDAAQVALDVAIEGTARAEQTIRAADIAEREAVAAEAACVASATQWAARGAQGDMDSESDLYARAQATRATASRARLAAKGAENALRQRIWNDRLNRSEAVWMTQSEIDARKSLEDATSEVNHAAAAVLVSEVAPMVARAAELRAELIDLLPSLAGFNRLSQQSTPIRPPASAIPDSLLGTVQALGNFSKSELVDLMAPWDDFAEKLLKDPEAQFCDDKLRRIPA